MKKQHLRLYKTKFEGSGPEWNILTIYCLRYEIHVWLGVHGQAGWKDYA